jgi:hypothetical protein
MRKWIAVSVLGALGLLLPGVASAFDYDEDVPPNVDLSTNAASPTPLTIALGNNRLRGSVVSSADTRDYITFTIPPGQQLDALNLLRWEQLPSGAPNLGFHFLDGPPPSVDPASNSGSFLGGDHVDAAHIGTNRLVALSDGLSGASTAGTGFTVPLPAGTYVYEIQQTSGQRMGYEIQFVVGNAPSPVPVFGTWAIAVVATGLVAAGGWILMRQRPRLA